MFRLADLYHKNNRKDVFDLVLDYAKERASAANDIVAELLDSRDFEKELEEVTKNHETCLKTTVWSDFHILDSIIWWKVISITFGRTIVHSTSSNWLSVHQLVGFLKWLFQQNWNAYGKWHTSSVRSELFSKAWIGSWKNWKPKDCQLHCAFHNCIWSSTTLRAWQNHLCDRKELFYIDKRKVEAGCGNIILKIQNLRCSFWA